MELFETLRELSEISAPAGHIRAIAQRAGELLEPLVDEVTRDRLDNVIGLKRGDGRSSVRMLLDAHLDEIGFMIIGHEEGFLRFRTLGGVDDRMLPGREMTLMTNPPGFGVVAVKPPHVLEEKEKEQALKIEDLYLDVGMSQEEAQKACPVGTTAVFRERCHRLAGSRVSGKALDDRSCFCVLLRTMELLQNVSLPYDVYVLGSNMEETGGTGATAAAFRIHPDMAVALDVTFATQNDVTRRQGFPLGDGPVIGVGPNMAGWMTRRMQKVAKQLELPGHLEVMSGRSGTNGEEIQISREGVATQVLSLPLRYMHTPIEEVDLEDLERTAQLLAAFLRDLGEEAPECFHW